MCESDVMSGEFASVPYFKDGEHPHHGAGAEVSGAHSLTFTNPATIDLDENKGEKAAMTSCKPKKTNKFNSRTCCEWAVVGTVIAVIWGLLMLPTIYYPQVQWRYSIAKL